MTDELQIGTRVRFRGIYLAGGKPDDPDQPHAILTTGTRTKVFSLVNGELRREKSGVYSFVMVVESTTKFVNVKFCSAQGLGQPFAEQAFKVVSNVPAMSPQQNTGRDIAGTIAGPVSDPLRARMVDALRADGVRIDDAHSDAFVSGAYEQLQRVREADRTKKLREFWSKR